MSTFWEIGKSSPKDNGSQASGDPPLSPSEAEAILSELASTYSKDLVGTLSGLHHFFERMDVQPVSEQQLPNVEAKYRALVEQLPAVVFMAYLDRGIGEAYVSAQIEATLGFSQAEWLEDPVLWYQQIHPDDKERWSIEASEMFLSGKPLRSAYRVIARNGRTIWFQCEAKMIRRPDGTPWFIHGIAFDITDLKQTEEELQEERNVVSGILDTVGALVVVLDREGGLCASTAPASR
jgi:PAS domain S-box-containing protein